MDNGSLSEDQLALQRISSGGRAGEKALEQLYRTYRRPMLAFARGRGRGLSLEEAEDVVQQVFIQVAQKAQTFRGDSAVSSWLFTMVRNAVVDLFRANHREVQLTEEGWDAIIDQTPDELACPLMPDPKKALQDCFDKAYAAFRKANPAAAEVVYRYMDLDWNTQELAQFLGRNAGAAREYLSQCKKKLKQYVEPCRDLLGANR
ncbi:RNA polymerase sigma factor [Rhodoferax antarcticus]|uniref:RNA polymerase sigma factor n=1 Tax=Rhodoferax antarcticus TaxID=81479 RepID=UPI0022258769|nr:RNA polymerase sigma factor [Rhodoferax antarcticus]MCW2314355.1 RNA polymerase sigma-70 factor (ECF subfamily) [Rhodoferax antarcticus]